MAPAKIHRRYKRGTRIVSGVEVEIIELVWNNGGRSFEVYRMCDDADLTIDGCFDAMPTDDEIRRLFPDQAGRDCEDADEGVWTCPGGCGRRINDSDADMIVDHVRDCDLVDGAGNPIKVN